jgi:plasmid stability protein
MAGIGGWPLLRDPKPSLGGFAERLGLTIRADKTLRTALEQRARAQRKTVSEVAREILRNALEERPLELKTGHLRGRLILRQEETEAWRKALRERNWRS